MLGVDEIISRMHSKKIKDFSAFFENEKEFNHIYHEIFENHSYYTELDNPEPIIIDLGAHIGVSTLFFKHMYPQARIIAVEPHPESLRILKLNIETNNLQNVTIVPAAIVPSNHDEKVKLYADATGSSWFSTTSIFPQAWNNLQPSKEIEVDTCTLADLIHGPIDLLKIDIEGAEYEILKDSAISLKQVKHMVMEYHPVAESNLGELVKMLEQLGFVVDIWKDAVPVKLPYTGTKLVLVEAHKNQS